MSVQAAACLLLGLALAVTAVSPRAHNELRLFRAPQDYELESGVALGAADGAPAGYRLRAALRVEPAWRDGDDWLLRLQLREARLWRPRAAPFAGGGAFWLLRRRGSAPQAYLDAAEPREQRDLKLAILSLFQFQTIDGEAVETDVSGSCNVTYETISMTEFIKVKTACGGDEPPGVRRVHYALSAGRDAVARVTAVDEVRVAAAGAELTARAELRLTAREAAPPPLHAPHDSLDAALQAMAPQLRARPLAPDDDDGADADAPSLEKALDENAAALEDGAEEAGGGGELRHARAALRLLRAFRAAPAPPLLALLRARPGVGAARLLGLAATPAAHLAADDFLQLAADPPRPLALAYLAAAGAAERPSAELLDALARLADDARAEPVQEAAMLAAAAAAAAEPARAVALRAVLARSLTRCRDDDCRVLRLHALGNLRREDTAELLLEYAERDECAVALAALDALATAPDAALTTPRQSRLEALAVRGGRALEVRAAALDLALRHLAPARLEGLARAMRGAPAELRRLLWQRASQRAAEKPALAAALAALPPADRGLAARAPGATSSVLVRSTGWAAGGWRARLESVQVAAAGLLRRGAVRLLAVAPDDAVSEQLSVEVWTRGMEALAGAGPEALAALDEGAGREREPEGGLALRVGGARLPPLRLFAGQAQLLALVWAGAGSEPTPVLRALRPLSAAEGRRRLLVGGALHWRSDAVLALALDAQAAVSLWSRSARLALELRAALAGEAALALAAPGGALRAAASSGAAPRLRLSADLDFYDGVALCVRAALSAPQCARNASLSGAGRSATRVGALWPGAGRTLALGRPNDATCRVLGAADAA